MEFLDYSLKPFKEFPDAKQAVATQRFRQFPDWKLPEFTDPEKPEPITGRHAEGSPVRPRSIRKQPRRAA